MKQIILIVCASLLFSCQSNDKVSQANQEATTVPPQDSVSKCSMELSPVIEVWNHSGSKYVIGDWPNQNESYLKSSGWNSSDSPYPKKFDLKLTIVNNSILYDNPKVIEDYQLSINMKVKVGQSKGATYPLNSSVNENIELIKDRLIKDADFTNGSSKLDHIDIWQKDIEFESLYSKYKSKGQYINQIIFEIHLLSRNSTCNYEYVFPMTETGEP